MSNKPKQKTLYLKKQRTLKKSDILYRLLTEKNLTVEQEVKIYELLVKEIGKEIPC